MSEPGEPGGRPGTEGDPAAGRSGRGARADYGLGGRDGLPAAGEGLQQRHHGDLALLGVSAGQRNPGLALNAGLALAGILSRDRPAWPRRVTVTLAAEPLVPAGFSGGWLAAGGHPSGGPRLALLAVMAAAMGMQATAVRRLGPMSTTYLTCTLTGILQALAIRRWPSHWQRSAGVLLAIAAGAVLGGLAALRAPAAVPAAILIPLAIAAACSLPRRGRVSRAVILRRPGYSPGRSGSDRLACSSLSSAPARLHSSAR
jgi:hypothetical protein